MESSYKHHHLLKVTTDRHKSPNGEDIQLESTNVTRAESGTSQSSPNTKLRRKSRASSESSGDDRIKGNQAALLKR